MNNKLTLILKSIIIGVCLSAAIRYGFQSVTFYPVFIIVLQLITIYFMEFAKPKTNPKIEIKKTQILTPNNVYIGQKLIHKEKGLIEVEGIKPHCGDYAIMTEDSWVYLKNCKLQ
jgi:hypothetical protein